MGAAYPSLLLLTAVALASAGSASAQKTTYPVRPVRLIVPFAPGGGTDVIARAVAIKVGEAMGGSIVIDNRGGGGGLIGAEIAVRAAPDGYTLLFDAASYTTRAALHRLPWDALDDMQPITVACASGHIMALHPSVPLRSLKEVIAHAREAPGRINYGSSGVGGFTHLGTELFALMAGIRMNHVPYKGTGPALSDLLGGQIQLLLGSLTTTAAHVRANRLRGVGVTTPKRWSGMPDLPAIAEALPGYDATVWYGLWGPRNLPREIATRWHEEIVRAIAHPDMKERMAAEGLEPWSLGPEPFRRLVEADIAKWTMVVRKASLKGG